VKRFWTYLLLGGVCMALGAAWFFHTFERKPVTEISPSRGEARYNRFLALQQALRKTGVPAASISSLTMPLHPGDLLLVGEDVSRVDVAQAAALASWVRAGGHLVFALPSAVSKDTPLFDALGAPELRAGKLGCLDMHTLQPLGVKIEATPGHWCARRFHPGSTARSYVALGDAADGYLMTRTALGRGSVTVLGDLQPLSFEGLREAGAQHLVWYVLEPDLHQGQVYLVYRLDGPMLLPLLLTRGWPALLALALLLVAWTTMRGQRLGPVVPMPPARRRALLEHVQAAGDFLYRRDSGRSLHRLACEATLARVARRDPFGAQLQGEPLYAWLAERSGLEPARVARAFESPANAGAFRASLAILARL